MPENLLKVLIAFCCLLVTFGQTSIAKAQDKPLKVYVLVGQSNMQGHAKTQTLSYLGHDPETKPILDAIQNEDGTPRQFENISVSYLSSAGIKTGKMTTGFGADENKIGPELTFGIYMQRRLGQPILIIKTAWGGKSLHTDFRPPSAGPFVFDDAMLERLKKQGKDISKIKAEREKATGVFYRQAVEHVKKVLSDIKSVKPDYDSNAGYELAGMVWFQGWNDMVDGGVYPNRDDAGGYDDYSKVLGHLIRDFRKDLSAPELPFVIGVMGVNGPTNLYPPNRKRYMSVHQNFRDAMAAPANEDEFKKNVVAVLTEDFWDMKIDALVERDAKIKGELKKLQREGKAEQKDWQANLKQRRSEEFTEEELQALNTAVSNAAYHYLGCGKIMARIGKGFADAMPVE